MPGSDAVYRDKRVAAGQRLPALLGAVVRLRDTPCWLVPALTFGAICLDSALVSDLNTIAPIFSSGLFLLLAFRRFAGVPRSALTATQEVAPRLALWRIFAFMALHVAIIGTALAWSDAFRANHTPNQALLLAASKYLIFLPTIVLLPGAMWRSFGRLYRAEAVAAAIALVSFYPLRIFTMAWPWYGQVLGRSVYALSHLIIPSTHYVPTLTPTLLGPQLDVTIVFGCGGLQGIKLFQILFALLLVVDWKGLNRRKALPAYLGGLGAMLAANVIRITLLFVLGNTSLQNRVIEYHLTAGWMLFTLAFIAYLIPVYPWLMKGPAETA